MKVTVNIDQDVYREFEYMVKLHSAHGAPNPHRNVEDLVNYVLSAVADGSRRPGSWERGLLQDMGLVADCDEHNTYRNYYGEQSEQ